MGLPLRQPGQLLQGAEVLSSGLQEPERGEAGQHAQIVGQGPGLSLVISLVVESVEGHRLMLFLCAL